MIVRPAQLRGLAVVAVVIAWALLAHFGSCRRRLGRYVRTLGVSPIMAAVGLLLWRTRHPLLAGGGTWLAAITLLWPTLRQNVALVFSSSTSAPTWRSPRCSGAACSVAARH